MIGAAGEGRALPVLLKYVGRVFLTRFIMLLIGLGVVLLALDLMTRAGDVLDGEGATIMSLARYASLRFPQLLAQLPPFTALLASLIVLAGLSQHSEIIVMKSAGLSSFRIVSPMVAVCGAIALVHFLFNETIVVDANRDLEQWRENDYAVTEKPLPPVATDTWAFDEGTLIRVRAVTRMGTILDRVTLFERDEKGLLSKMVNANFAAYVKGRWTLFDVKTFEVKPHRLIKQAEMIWPTKVPPERFLALSAQPDKMPFTKLWTTIRQLKREGQSVETLVSWLNQKIAGPFSSLLMPLLGAIAGFGVHRAGTLFIRIAAGMAFGFSFFVVDNLLLAMGQFGSLPPFLAAWVSFILFLILGVSVILYTEE
jgi:lipopolysaccharide export system permease protein